MDQDMQRRMAARMDAMVMEILTGQTATLVDAAPQEPGSASV